MEDGKWNALYKIAAIAASVTIVSIVVHAAVFMKWPPPVTVAEYFALFQKSWLLGILSLDFLLILDNLLLIPIYLALYLALRKYNPLLMAITGILGIFTIVLYLASREATFGLWALSNQFSGVTTETQKIVLLSAGQAMLSSYNGTAFNLSYILGQLAGVLVSIVMLQSKTFSKVGAWAGIIGNIVGYGLYIPTVGVYISLFSVIGLFIWYIAVAKGFFRLAHQTYER